MQKLVMVAAMAPLFFLACASSNVDPQPHNMGDLAYNFTLPDQDGNMVALNEVLNEYSGAVIAFYPKDDSKY